MKPMLLPLPPMLLLLLLVLACHPAAGSDFVPSQHGLRYVGHEGVTPVTVELTLTAQLDGSYDYVEWVAPRSWAAWFRKTTVTRSRLAYQDERLVPLGIDSGAGVERPPAGLAAGALDVLSVRLRARGDIARGLRHAEYLVWTGGDRLESWTLQVNGTATVETPNGRYDCLKFRLGSDTEWIEGWSSPLLVFHFARLERWRDGRKTGELLLDDKQL
jgi:hypothetical protein